MLVYTILSNRRCASSLPFPRRKIFSQRLNLSRVRPLLKVSDPPGESKMVIIMTTELGKRIEDEFGAFEDEVQYAQWLPQPVLELGLQELPREAATRPELDVGAYLRRIYLAQE